MRHFNLGDVLTGCQRIATNFKDSKPHPCGNTVYGVPRGGIPVAYMLAQLGFCVTDDPHEAALIVDDLIDSGATARRYQGRYPQAMFAALYTKQPGDGWVTFPWERGEEGKGDGGEDIVLRLLKYVGEDPEREGLLETPARVLKAWRHWCSGYGVDPASVLKTFEDGAEGVDEMVVVRDIPFYSHCEHHLAPIFGTATIAYIPDRRIVGLSKLSRLLDVFARRLQVQERLTNQVADALMEGLAPQGVGVLIRARHLCMESRGICKQGHETVTSAMRGALFSKPEARAEFLALAR
jgi:GTP cyclohydrolase I